MLSNESTEIIEYLAEDGEIHRVKTGERVEYLPRLVIAHICNVDYTEDSRAVPSNISQ